MRKKKKKSEFVETDLYKYIDTLLKMGDHLLLVGPPGIGKTYSVKKWAEKNGYDLFSITLTEQSGEWSLVGTPGVVITVDSSTDVDEVASKLKRLRKQLWLDAVVTKALRNALDRKTLLLVDEINLADQSVTTGVFNQILENDGEAKLTIKDTGETIPVNKENFKFVATMNPGLSGTRSLNEALESRFTRVEVDYPPMRVLKNIVKAQANVYPPEEVISFFDSILKNTEIKPTIRQLIKWCRAYYVLDKDKYKTYVLQSFRTIERPTITGLYNSIIMKEV